MSKVIDQITGKMAPIAYLKKRLVAPTFWEAILFAVILLLERFSKMMCSQVVIKAGFTQLNLVGEGQLWLDGLVTITCKFSISCDSSLIDAKFSSSLQLLSTRKHDEEKPIFDLLDQQNNTLAVEFIIIVGFQCSRSRAENVRQQLF